MANPTNNTRSLRLITIYAWVAAAIIFAFQLYWLYTTYTIQEGQLRSRLDTDLREYVLGNDTRTLLHSGIGEGTSLSPEALAKGASRSPLKGMDVQIQVLGDSKEPVTDALIREKIDSVLAVSKIPRNDSLSAGKFVAEMKDKLPEMKFGLLSKGKMYPPEVATSAPMKVSAASQLNPLENYTLLVYNPARVVINGMWGAIAVSLVYLGVCLGAVYILLRNVRRNRLLMEAKDNFTQNMTHELKTPLATLSAAAEALHTYNFIDNKEVAREYLGIMINDIKKLDAMTSAILTNARLNNNTAAMKLENTNLRELVDEVLAGFKPRIISLDAEVSVRIDDSLTVLADRLHLGNVFSNLIDNALKYSTAKPVITISAAKEDSQCRITVEDNGIGVNPSFHKEIFKPYFRVHEGDLHTVKGFGIGLTYAHEVISRHGGTIRVLSSEKDKGTTFEIILPAGHE